MKKLKIVLMLSILLLCFGFVSSFEVHASGPKILQENTYLTFQSTSSFTLEVNDNTKHWDGVLYYSTDTTTWVEWDGTTTLSSVGNKLYLRGTGNTIITGTSADNRWVLVGSNIECIGNIENLLDYETVALGNHPTMANSCYYYMFYGCTGLTTAPSLPATTLASSCYEGMFWNCTGLTTAPSLPATTLADHCYRNMFSGCTGLATAPSLPATTLANSCYYSMFNGCTSLTTAPSLPATTLVDHCYRNMFSGCTALKVSTTKEGSYQYAWRIPTSGTITTTPTQWNNNMLYNTGGTFKGNPTINTTYYVENPPVSGSGFNITFEENGGTVISDIEGATVLPTPLPIPTKDNHTFLGWYYDSDFTNEAFAGEPLTGDVTLYAKWVLTNGPKVFQVGDVLPAEYIKISWDYNGFSYAGDEFISIEGTNGFIINIILDFSEPSVQTIVMGDSFDTVVGNIMIKLDNISVITKIESDREYLPSGLQNGIFWEVVTVDEYSLGYEDARDKFGYYDPITQRWLSVSEYLDLYGYEKLGQTDFYNNFDKYFIPAMIIVFGGAIVLTVLKVFKGRE